MSSSLPSQSQSQTDSNSQIQDELAHVNQEMYKKNLELARKNKLLSLLRQIDSIILSTVTNIHQIAEQVANIVVDETEFIKVVSILLLDKNSGHLIGLAVSQTEEIKKAEAQLNRTFQGISIPLENNDNIVVKAVKERKMLLTHELYYVLTPHFTKEESIRTQGILHTDASYVYPLIIRGDIIGAMVINLQGDEKPLSYDEIDLIDRMPGIIAIAIDNALLYQTIQEANDRLKQVDKLKDEFVSLASHELRTPMTVVRSYAWMLLNQTVGNLSEKQRTYLERIFTSTEGLIKLVNDMLNISRIESGRLTIEPVPTDIGKLVSGVVTEMQTRAAEVGVNLLYDPPHIPLIVKADIERVKEVIINLVGNSIKFTPKDGSVTVIVEKNEQGFAVTKIKDTGRGISKENMNKLFQKFNMVGDIHLTKDRDQGTGLGLYLSKSLVELHGGRIWAESEGEGKGATFSFTLPLGDSGLLQQATERAVAGSQEQKINKYLPPVLNPRG